ncbi:FAD-binding oxidoreductase [Pelagerythrobacter rhizovicinus]|uniref:FAD-binding oxidoreductase n=1 Tax=Pelagerythrobacter rhizovicinus TaxID=2268576 RepID=A0A4Q2KIH0_9SPHN|nr:FAD-binding oxidoreductase [Pelagerythrobacter rhizovicinus]RXZ63970.1 FAD-binding oxidoreductase [Pelagerythrobacter rhizovicinus]
MRDPDAFLASAAELLGERGFTRDRELMAPWLTDWRGRYTGNALAMASPASTEEVSRIVQLCAHHRVPIVPQGGNSGMSGGATPDGGGEALLLSLRRLSAIRTIDTDSRQAICEAGVILQTLHEAAAEKRLRFPLTLGGKGSATVGGLIATNAGGTQVLRHGTMRAQVLGLEAVLADGSVFDALTPLKKDNRGFDLKQLLIGSEGTLGIVTAATLRLLPEVGERAVLWAGLNSIGDARRLLLHCEARAENHLEGFEIIPAHCLSAVLDHLPDARSPLASEHRWHALIELVVEQGADEDLPGLAESLLSEGFETGLIEDATIAASEIQAEQFWLLRDSISPAERAIGPAMQHDISVPVARMAEFVEAAVPQVESRFPGVTAVAFGHLGDGNVHFHVLAPGGVARGEWEEGEGKAISAFVHDLVTRWGGSISAEHGIGQMKRDELGRLGNPVALAMMRSVKQALDPHALLNPGKLVPLAPEAHNN